MFKYSIMCRIIKNQDPVFISNQNIHPNKKKLARRNLIKANLNCFTSYDKPFIVDGSLSQTPNPK